MLGLFRVRSLVRRGKGGGGWFSTLPVGLNGGIGSNFGAKCDWERGVRFCNVQAGLGVNSEEAASDLGAKAVPDRGQFYK